MEDSAEHLLRASAAAILATPAVSYDFQWGGPEDPTGFLTGTTRMMRRTDAADSWYRVEGTVHAQPEFGIEERRFAYAVDGENAWATEGDDGVVRTAPVGDGANRLAATAVYGFLPEFIEAQPFWKELAPTSTSVVVGVDTVDGEVCDVIRVEMRPDGGAPSSVEWAIGRDSLLPLRGYWPGGSTTPAMTFSLSGVNAEADLPRDLFRLSPVASGGGPVEAVVGSALGARAPGFDLATPDGERIDLASLRGRVVVLDFWNTWCLLCRSMGPDTRRLAASLADQPVTFLGVNVFETGDPQAYWREVEAPYPLLLGGEELARALDLPWQPGVAVVDPSGRLVYKELGASPDRAEKIRRAIESALPSS